jgi:hypothetical protein
MNQIKTSNMDKWMKLEKDIGDKLSTYTGDSYGNYLYDFKNFNSPFNDDFDKLYFQSTNDDYFWLYCQMKAYKRTFKDRFEQFKNYYIDGEISDFAEQELKQFKKKSFPIGIAGSQGLEASNSYYEEYSYFNHKLKRICKKEIFDKMEFTQNKKIEYLNTVKERNKFDDSVIETSEHENKHVENIQKEIIPVPLNPHSRIFPNGKCWQLFEHWRNDVKERTKLAEFSFIFWQMQKDGLICENIKPTEFRNWLQKTFDIELDQLKQLTISDGGNKYSRYQTAKLLYQC